MVSFHILLLDRAGNNLVNADFSPYSRMFFAVKHIYLTLYVVYTCRTAPIYSVPACFHARARVCAAVCPCSLRSLSVLFAALAVPAPVWPCAPPARSLPADRRACGRVAVPAPVPAPARGRACVRARCARCLCGRVAALAARSARRRIRFPRL